MAHCRLHDEVNVLPQSCTCSRVPCHHCGRPETQHSGPQRLCPLYTTYRPVEPVNPTALKPGPHASHSGETQVTVCWCDKHFNVPACCGRYLEDVCGNIVHTPGICYEKRADGNTRILAGSGVLLSARHGSFETLDLHED